MNKNRINKYWKFIFCFRYVVSWNLFCSEDVFVRFFCNRLEPIDSNKFFSGKKIQGEYLAHVKQFNILNFNSFFNSRGFDSQTTIIHSGSNPILIRMEIKNSSQIYLWGFIFIASMFIIHLNLKNIVISFFVSYFFCAIIFWMEIIMKHSIIHDILLIPKFKLNRVHPDNIPQ